MLKRRAQVEWRGDGLKGEGAITTQSRALENLPYSTALRFENKDGKAGSNPEELIAAAHAACFNMALSFKIAGAGYKEGILNTEAVVVMEQEGVDWTVTEIHLKLRGSSYDGMTNEAFVELAKQAKQTCPISQLVKAKIVLDAALI